MNGRLRILCYHALEPVHVPAFRAQLETLRTKGWHFVALEHGLQALAKGHDGDFACVTFDDGDAGACHSALPVLNDLNITALMYVTTDFVERGQTYRSAHPRPAAKWEDLHRWRDAGHQVGSHTHTHVDMTLCTPEQLNEELTTSANLIEQHLGVRPVDLSYPWGKSDPRTQDLVRQMGWRSAATIDRGWNEGEFDPMCLRRDLMEGSWSTPQWRLRLALGAYGPVYNLQRRVRGRKQPQD